MASGLPPPGSEVPENRDDSSPETSPGRNDPGDETARRYRYQWTYAAITCCALLDDTEGVAEVFCEHHEDVLIKYDDGSFAGLQVKTRAADQPVWKSSDPAVLESCKRFAQLERDFPGRFRAFRFLTNHPLHAAKNGQDFRHVLGSVQQANSPADLSAVAKAYVARIAKATGCSEQVAFTALAKTEARDDLPKLPDAQARLETTLSVVWEGAESCSAAELRAAARSLVTTCQEASSLAHEDTLPGYFSAIADEDQALIARIEGKRVDRSRVDEALSVAAYTAPTLDADPEQLSEPGTGSASLLRAKLDAGGFSVVSQNSAEDLRDKAEYLAISWTQKLGRTAGLQRYGHLRSLVLHDAADAFESEKVRHDPFGLDMLAELRAKLHSRQQDGSQVYGCSNEHLEGISYALTSECQVHWSIGRPWEQCD
jgi:hypothetical protein